MKELVDKLLNSSEPSIRWKVRVNVLKEDPSSKDIKKLSEEIKKSRIVKALLSRYKNGKISGTNTYSKWQGPHWIMASLADIGYPEGDKKLLPLRDQLCNSWLNPHYFKEVEVEKKVKSYNTEGVPVMQGRHRRCASQQSNALYSIMKLGLDDKRVHDLAERLMHWQWPDGGWNCDRNPEADTSSFMETIIPLRALRLYSKKYRSRKAGAAAKKAAEVFLQRKLYKGRSNGKIIHPEFTYLHYPLYWHYDILHGLKILAESGFIKDKRCKDALDLLEQKQLPVGGWAAQKKYYTKVSDQIIHGADYVKWGETGKTRMNEWVTADALYVLKEAGRGKNIIFP